LALVCFPADELIANINNTKILGHDITASSLARNHNA
jgi:hypothetical protein